MKTSISLFVCISTLGLASGRLAAPFSWKLPNNTQGRIVNGKPALWKYRKGTALVMYYDWIYRSYYGHCTGSLIGRKWVLSAAHCFEDAEGRVIGAEFAEWGIIPATEWANARDAEENGIFAKRIWIHKRYSGNDGSNYDIALLQLKDFVPLSRYTKVHLTTPPADRSKVKAVGYGALDESETPAQRANMVDVVYKNFDWCIKNEEFENNLQSDKMICAVSIGFGNELSVQSDTCYGDSGGPLFKTRQDEKLYQIGITSFSKSECASAYGIPWYARVDYFIEEIKKCRIHSSNEFYAVKGDQSLSHS